MTLQFFHDCQTFLYLSKDSNIWKGEYFMFYFLEDIELDIVKFLNCFWFWNKPDYLFV